MCRPGLTAAFAALSVIAAACEAAATSRAAVGVDYFTHDGQRSELGTGLSGMSDTILSQLLADPANKDCALDQVEIRRTEERRRELELGRSPLIDPRSRVTDRTIAPTHVITGSVLPGVDGGSYAINLVDARTSQIIGSVSGRGTGIAGLESALRESLTELLEKLCPRVHHLKASTGPYFQIDSRVCGFDRPFRVNAKGAFAGVALEFKPSSRNGGSFTQGGRAFGTQWKGGGEYTVSWSGDSGAFSASDSYVASNQAGRAETPNDRMTGTVTRLKQTCRR